MPSKTTTRSSKVETFLFWAAFTQQLAALVLGTVQQVRDSKKTLEKPDESDLDFNPGPQ
jgi:hypothetical protein